MFIQPEILNVPNCSGLSLVSADWVASSAFLAYYNTLLEESVMMGNVPGDGPTNKYEASGYLKALVNSATVLSAFCLYEHRVIGRVDLILHEHIMAQHRATVSVAVLRAYQGQGIATAMLQRIMEIARKSVKVSQFELTVYTNNQTALHLYDKLGFRIVGLLPNSAHTPDGEVLDEYIMVRPPDEVGGGYNVAGQ